MSILACPICQHAVDSIEIRDNGFSVALLCDLRHIVANYHVGDLVQARIQAEELARVYKVRVLEL